MPTLDWQIVDLAQVPPSPWKNGGGVTRELVVWPNGDNWDWRMSVAEVASDGAFSRFEGVQRWFAVLDGTGVQLQLNDGVHALTIESAPFCFDGSVPVDCKLLSGTTQDFNLMTRSSKADATMRRLNGNVKLSIIDIKMIAIYAINTPATVIFNGVIQLIAANSLAWCVAPAGASLVVDADSALWMEITACT